MAISRFSNSTVANGFPKYQRFWDQSSVEINSSYESIATVTVGSGGTANITFSSIPQTYTHLQLRGISKETNAGFGMNNCPAYFNGDTTSSNYSSHNINGNGSTAGTSGSANSAGGSWYNAYGSNLGFAGIIFDILDYTNTNKFKTFRAFTGSDTNGSGGGIYLSSNNWRNTAAITSIRLQTDVSFAQFSSFALYGIKGA